jgi:adenylate cyclase
MPSKRQLAAIMFTDIAGYTAVMGRDERAALDMLKRNRKIHQSCANKYGGQLLKEMGDGTLLSFQNASDAVLCAVAILEKATAQGLVLRAGVHQGEVIFESGDVFGDGVNIASRIETEAQPGKALVSEAIAREIKNKPGITTDFVGERALKNVDASWRLYEVKVDFTLAEMETPADEKDSTSKFSNRFRRWISVGAVLIAALLFTIFVLKPGSSKVQDDLDALNSDIPRQSVAILPFANLSDDPEQEYFTDGICQDILMHLASIEDLRVVAFNSSRRYRDQDSQDNRKIAEELGARHLVTGSIQRSGNRIVIRSELIDVLDNDRTIWAKRFEATSTDIFKVQATVSEAIAEDLQVNILTTTSERLHQSPTDNFQAYLLYSQGRHEWAKRTVASHQKALDYFTQAVALDSNYAWGYLGLAQNYLTMGHSSYVPADSAYPKALEYAETALLHDPQLGEAFAVIGSYHSHYTKDFPAAIAYFEKALDIRPGFAYTHQWMAEAQMSLGNIEKARDYIERAIQLDPAAPSNRVIQANVYYVLAEYDKSLKIGKESLNQHPGLTYAYPAVISSLAKLERFAELDSLLAKVPTLELRLIRRSIVFMALHEYDSLLTIYQRLESIDRSLVFGVERMIESRIPLVEGDIVEFIRRTEDYLFRDRVFSLISLQALPPPDFVLDSPEWQDFEQRRGFRIYRR